MFRLGTRWHPHADVSCASPAPMGPAAAEVRVAEVTAFLDRRLVELTRDANAHGEPPNPEAVAVCLDALALLRPDGSR